MKLVSIVSGTFNEEGNVQAFYDRVRAAMESLPDYRWELIVIDNCSRDRTVPILRRIAAADRRVRVIVNTRNFGAIRSIYHAFLQAYGDAVIIIASDLQEPPELIPEFIGKWEQGYKVALGIRSGSRESALMQAIRSLYYTIVNRLSDIELHRHATGFGLYDQEILEILRKIDDPFPYLRGLVCDIGYERALVPFVQPKRQHGRTSNSLYSLYDLAMLGITNHSKVPLRLATFFGFLVGTLSLVCAFGYLAYKLLYWDRFEVGMAPAAIGIFFFGGVQLFFVGIMGEYILAIHTQVQKRPLVVERERINFEEPPACPGR